MRTPELLDADGLRRWFLDAPEAEVMTAARERELLLELADCRRVILRATRRPDGSEWDLTRPDAEFRRAVRGLAGDGRRDDDARTTTATAAADGSPGDPRIASIRTWRAATRRSAACWRWPIRGSWRTSPGDTSTGGSRRPT